MGWTDDLDTEGLVEENPFIFIIIGIIGAVAVSILYLVGIEYDPGWFEGQNLVSTMGIIFLIIFIPAIAISTLTGKSDLVKWEAIFLLLAVAMVWIGNNFSFQKFIEAFNSQFSFLNINSNLGKLLMFLLIIIGIGMAIAVASGHKIGTGAVLLILALIAVIGIINLWNSDYFQNIQQYISEKGIWFALGKALSDFTGGLASGAAGTAIGIGCIAVGIALCLIPSTSTFAGIILIIIGSGILGVSIYNWIVGLIVYTPRFWNEEKEMIT